MEGFFSGSKIRAGPKPLPLLPQCGKCGLYKTCQSKYMPPSGKGKRRILVVGEAPGKEDDDQGVQFVGKDGRHLRSTLRELGLDPNRDCRFTNALICHPKDNEVKDGGVVEYCRPNLLKEINDFEPHTIVLLGRFAVRSLVGFLWKEEVGEMTKWVGWKIPSQRFNCWVCPTYHPTYVLREENKVLSMYWKRHLKEAVALEGRPWEKVPDYKNQVVTMTNTEMAANAIRTFIKKGKTVAFDYETNMLKPDSPNARIVCCSVSDGKVTIAFPWHGPVVEAMKELLRSRVPKVASNMKFEERWSRAVLGVRVRNWDWDTMLAGHVLDNRDGITSIKFQSFVRLGQEEYDSHVKPYLKPRKGGGGYNPNQISKCDLEDLMVYCGLDSLLELKVSKLQKEEMKSGTGER